MIIPLGEMRFPALILTPVRVADQSGGEEISYTESDPVWLALRSVSTNERVQFGQLAADISHVAFGHWSDLNGLTAEHRIRSFEDASLEFDISGGPINSPKRDHTRLNLVQRENG